MKGGDFMDKLKKIGGLVSIIVFTAITTMISNTIQEQEIKKTVKEEIAKQQKGEA